VVSRDELLLATSRTFALAIPLLPDPTRTAVRTAYLLFRIADTFEDAAQWPRERRIAALGELVPLLRSCDLAAARERADAWAAAGASDVEGYVTLLRETPAVLEDLASLSPASRAIVTRHAVRTTEGMARVVESSDEGGRLQLDDVASVRAYCYVVAGIVGELLTEVFLADCPALAAVRPELEATQIAFGEGLQLVNILKDVTDDARDGRRYVPTGGRQELLALARADLLEASRYVAALARGGAPRGFLAFTAFPLLLARETLDRLEIEGHGAKIGRARVGALFAHVQEAPVDDQAAALLRPEAPGSPAEPAR
jgi:farnesyl-diphosphate farnesyltransferase